MEPGAGYAKAGFQSGGCRRLWRMCFALRERPKTENAQLGGGKDLKCFGGGYVLSFGRRGGGGGNFRS